MSKFFLFLPLWWLFGNPLVAFIVFLIILYFLDRRFIGFMPNITRPFTLMRKMSRMKSQLALSPHDSSLKLSLARIHLERKQYRHAAQYLEQLLPLFGESADVPYELGQCYLHLGRLEEGEQLILRALELNPRVGYGDPYLRLAEALAARDPDRAIGYLERFREANSSSCEAYYRLGMLYAQLGRQPDAKGAFGEAVDIYRSLPRYKRRSERKWAWLARLRNRS